MGNDYQLRILGGEASADLRSLISDMLVTSSVWKFHKRLTKSFSDRLQTS